MRLTHIKPVTTAASAALAIVYKQVVASNPGSGSSGALAVSRLLLLLPLALLLLPLALLLLLPPRTCSMALPRSRVSKMQMLLSVLQLANTLSSLGDHCRSSTLPLCPLYGDDTWQIRQRQTPEELKHMLCHMCAPRTVPNTASASVIMGKAIEDPGVGRMCYRMTQESHCTELVSSAVIRDPARQ
jgi:hypothetical protein